MSDQNEAVPAGSRQSGNKGKKGSQVRRALADQAAIEWAVSFIERFENPVEKSATLHGSVELPDGKMTFPWYKYSSAVTDFLEGLYTRGLILNFNWSAWEPGKKLLNNPRLIQRARAGTCLKLITRCARMDKFSEGALGLAVERGIITACLKRIRDLRSSPGEWRQ